MKVEAMSAENAAIVGTYRQLRMGMVVLILLLAVAIGLDANASGWRFQPSISDYYFTSVHVIFIGVLCALGACLIVYKGSTDAEDTVLNFSGFLAFVVAMVPTEHSGNSYTYDTDTSVGVSVSALLITGIVAIAGTSLLTSIMARRTGAVGPEPGPGDRTDRFVQGLTTLLGRSAVGRYIGGHAVMIIRVLGWAIVAFLGVLFVVARNTFIAIAHPIAAITMFLGIILVVVINAYLAYYGRATHPIRFFWVYLAIALAMLVTVIAAGVLALNHVGHLVIAVETLLILEFAAFWIVQTLDLWSGLRNVNRYPVRHVGGE